MIFITRITCKNYFLIAWEAQCRNMVQKSWNLLFALCPKTCYMQSSFWMSDITFQSKQMPWWILQTKCKMSCIFLLLWLSVSNQLVKYCLKIVIATSFWLVPSSLLNEMLTLGVGHVNLVVMSVWLSVIILSASVLSATVLSSSYLLFCWCCKFVL